MNERFLELSPRLEETRDRQVPQIIKFELDEIKNHFDEDLIAIRSLSNVYQQLDENQNDASSELILRSQVILLESAFDFYLHELTKFGVNKIFEKSWAPTEKYKRIILRLELVEKIINNEVDENWFLEYISQYYSKDTMVSFKTLSGQMNLLGLDIQVIADRAFCKNNSSETTITQMRKIVRNLYKRRNVIAHQSNCGHEDAVHYQISKEQVVEFIENIESIVNAIHNVANEHD